MENNAKEPLRIVLFGLPRAGKTALLAALSQSQETQPSLLPGPLKDISGALTQQRQLQYDELPRSTEGATVSYPIRLDTPGEPLDAELIDCDGRLVLDLIKNRTSLDAATGTLPQAILSADSLLLLCDVSLKPEMLEKVLAAFDDFLSRHEQLRGSQADVAGLPVFLVLTKCDLLAEDQDGPAGWMGKIEAQKRQATRKLQEFLDDAKKSRPTAFGRLEIHVWATATKRPPLGTIAARPREPYGVAELFRQTLTEAKQYRQRQERSDSRLRWTIGGVSGVAAALVLLTGTLLSGVTSRQPNELQRKVERYLALEGNTLEDRLHDWPQDLKDRLADLESFRTDADFGKLSEELREKVEDRRDELKQYLPYLEKVISPRFASPARTETELLKREKTLLRDLGLPKPEWGVSGAGKLRQQRLDDLKLLRERAERTVAWFQQLYRQGDDLAKFRQPARQGDLIFWRIWQDEVELYLSKAVVPPPAAQELPQQSLITTNAVMRFDKVRTARENVLGPDPGRKGPVGAVQSLLTTREIAAVLGLTDSTVERPALLAIPRPPGLAQADAVQRWRRLESQAELSASLAGLMANPGVGPHLAYLGAAVTFVPGHPLIPPYPDFYREFNLDRVPDAARVAVIAAADSSYQYLLAPMQDVIRKKLEEIKGGMEETLAHWTTLGMWLESNPPEVRAQRRLAEVLDRLRRLVPSDPVTALAGFLRKGEHTMDVREVTLTVPFTQGVSPPDRAVLTIRAGKREVGFRLDPDRTETNTQTKTTVYRFPGPAIRVALKAGEPCEAVLELRGDKVFTWTGSRSASFAFECLARPPRLHDKGEAAAQGLLASGVVLKFDATPGLPAVPDLLPEIRPSAREP